MEKGTCEDGEQLFSILLHKLVGGFRSNMFVLFFSEKSAGGAGTGPAIPGYNEESRAKICHSGAASAFYVVKTKLYFIVYTIVLCRVCGG